MAEENLRQFVYRVIRYTPNLVRDEWVNIGVLLEDAPPDGGALREHVRREARLIDEPAEFARVRRPIPRRMRTYCGRLLSISTHGYGPAAPGMETRARHNFCGA